MGIYNENVEAWAKRLGRRLMEQRERHPLRDAWTEAQLLGPDGLELATGESGGASVKLQAACAMIGLIRERGAGAKGELRYRWTDEGLTPAQARFRSEHGISGGARAAPPDRPAVASEAPPSEAPEPPWQHPGTVPRPENVIVIGLGPSKHSLFELQTAHQPPTWSVDEVWGLNAGVNWLSGRVTFDLLWVMDYLDGEAAKHPQYGAALRKWATDHGRGIMTSDPGSFADVATPFPLSRLWAALYAEAECPPYFRNSLPYIIAYAYWIGVKRLYLWGVDYTHPALGNAREDDRANCEYWVGYVRAKGMQVILPQTSTLLKTNEPVQLYGYPPGAERHPRFDGGRLL